MKISKLVEKDVLEIVNLELSILGETLGEEMILSELDSNFLTFLKIVDQDKIVGYIGFSNVFGEVEIINFLIIEAYQRMGLGQAVFDYMIKSIGDYESITLEVKVNNQKGINFYLKNGFKEVSKRKNYYKDGSDALIYKKEKIK